MLSGFRSYGNDSGVEDLLTGNRSGIGYRLSREVNSIEAEDSVMGMSMGGNVGGSG